MGLHLRHLQRCDGGTWIGEDEVPPRRWATEPMDWVCLLPGVAKVEIVETVIVRYVFGGTPQEILEKSAIIE